MTHYCTAIVDGHKVFYREVGDPEAPSLLLLRGFPTSSHMFRDLIPLLADRYHVVAPDLLGFGFSDAPDRTQLKYTFDNLTKIVDAFTEAIGLKRYAIYVFDYGAPIGFRLALAHPERVTAIIPQNGNAYEEGLSQGRNPIQKYWNEPTDANRSALREFLKPEATRLQYVFGVPDGTQVAPESYTLDSALLARPGNDEIQGAAGGDAGETVKPVATHDLPNLPGKRLTTIVVTYAPGAKSARHHHAGSVWAYVLSAWWCRADLAPGA